MLGLQVVCTDDITERGQVPTVCLRRGDQAFDRRTEERSRPAWSRNRGVDAATNAAAKVYGIDPVM